MVNNAVVGLLLGVLIGAALAAGVLGVLDAGGSNPDGTVTPTDIEPTPLGAGGTPSSVPSATPTPTPEPVPTTTARPTTVARTTIAADEFQPREIEAAIRRLVNDRRKARDLEPFRRKEPVKQLNRMARNHSQEMAKINGVAHTIDGRTTKDRFEQYGLYGTCRWKAAGENYVIRADKPRPSQLEVVGLTIAGRPYPADGQPRFNANETQVAQALVTDWFAGYPDESKFYLPKATQMGVGVHVTLSGEAYATVAIC